MKILHVLCAFVLLMIAQSGRPDESKTVIGPDNIYLYDGANALKAGDGEKGVRLTLQGLEFAQNPREEKAAHANLCAGYLLMNEPETALVHCNWVLERDSKHWRTYNNRALVYLRLERFDESAEDIRRGQELNPASTNLKIVKGMYLDETQPVRPRIETDERRNVTDGFSDEPAGDAED